MLGGDVLRVEEDELEDVERDTWCGAWEEEAEEETRRKSLS